MDYAVLYCKRKINEICNMLNQSIEYDSWTATLPETFTAGEEVTVNGKDFVTAAKLILKNSADATKTLDIEGAAFTATSVTFTVPADAEAGN